MFLSLVAPGLLVLDISIKRQHRNHYYFQIETYLKELKDTKNIL